MGMPCSVNSILKLSSVQGFPAELRLGAVYTALKDGYRILPLDVPIQLVDQGWLAQGDVIVRQLVWENNSTALRFELVKIYAQPIALKS
jgi:hypothetical protein